MNELGDARFGERGHRTYEFRDAEELLPRGRRVDSGGPDLPVTAVRDTFAAQRASDDLVPKADA